VQVNLVTSDSQWNPTVIALPPEDGGFLVVWQQLDGSGWGVFARRFDEAFNEVKLKDASGAEVSVLQVNANVPGSQGEPSAALLQDGSVVVAWQDDSDGSSYGVYSHRIDATGQLAAGADVLVNTIIGDQQRGVELAALTTGGYVAVYKSHGHDGSGWGVYGQRFLANGDKDGGEFLVNTYTDSSQGEGDFDQHRDPDVAGLADGGFVVVWETYTGADTDASSYGIAGQRYNAAGQPVGTEFLINGIARDAQIQATVEATPDGGFVVGWASENADANSYAVAVRRFDANGNATEPYGNDVIANTYTLNNQSAPALAMLERGFVAVWHSNGQDGSGWSIQMQRFEGKGLEPPPYVVDAATGGNSSGDLIFSTIAEAVAAANGPDGTPSATIVIRGGTYTLPSTVTITADDLTIRNFEGETVVINGPAGAAAFVVGSGKNATFESELLGKLTINAGAGAPTAIDFAGLNGGSELSRVAVNAAGGNAVRFGGGQNGVVVEDSAFGGTSTQPLVLVLGAFSGAAASSGMIFEDNQFAPNGGSGLVSEATGDTIVENTFGGTIGAGFAALVLRAAGADVQDNIFSAAGAGARIYDIANAYSESALLANNAFPAGWVSVDGKNNLFGRVAEALTVVDPSGVVRLSGHDRAIEGVLTVVDDALTIDGGAAATGLDLLLGAGVAAISLAGASGTDVTGNALANTLNGSGGANALDGSSGGDTINGGSGADTLGGGDGDDVLAGDGDADLVAGGAGNDAVIYRVAEGADTISGGTGNDTLQVQATNFSSGDQLTLTGTASGFTAAFTGHGAGASVDGVEVVDVTLDGTDGVTLTGTMTGVTGVIVRGGNGNTVADASALVGAPVAFTGGDGLDTLTGGASLLDSVDYAAETGGAAVGVNLSGAAVTFGAVNLAAGRAIDSFGDLDTLSGIENVRTGAGADRIWGSNSANVFEAGAGADTLTGGGGIDSFVFQAGFGADRITDFDVQEEVLRFSSAVFANRAAALAAASAAGGNTTIAAGGGNTVTLSGATGLGAWNIDILGVNDGPTIRASTPAAAVEAGVAGAGTPSAVAQLRVRDVDGVAGYDAAALTAAGWTAGAGGVWTKGGTYGQAVLDTAASTLTYQLDNADADTQALRTGSVTETFAVPVIDNGGLTASTNVVFSITAANDAPVAVADAASAAEAGVNAGSNATGNVLTNDTDVDASDTKAVSAVAFGATSGTVGSALAGAYGSLTLNANGGFSYAVNNANASVQALRTAGQTLTETFSYTVVDAAGATSTSTLTVTITGANDAPVAVADTGTAREAGVAAGQAGSGNVLTNDTDVDVQGETKAVSAVAFGATAGTLGAALTGQYGALTLNANGTWSYVVNDANASVQALRTTGQTLTDTFSYTVRDAAGATSTANAVIGVADAATAVEAGTAAGSNAVGNVLTNDTDVDAGDTKTVSAVAFGATAGVVGAALNGEYGALTVNADGTFSYAVDNADPAVQALRTAGQTLTETFTYTVRDTAGATSTASLTVTIQGANDAPVAVNNTGTAAEAGAVAAGANANGNVLNNDTDVDAGDTKRISGFSFGATNGVVGSALEGAYGTLTVNANGSWTYVVDQDDPAVQALRTSGQTLTETFRYVVRDAANASDQGVLTITITGANDAPVAVADAGTAVEAGVGPGSNATGDVLANDTDPDVQGETRTVTGFSFGAATAAAGATLAGEYGSLRINANGSYSYVVDNADPAVHALANSGQTLTDTFSYTMRDAAGATSTATLVITVVGQNDAPAAQPDGFTITRDVELTLPGALFTGNDSDVEGGTLSVTAVSNVTGGTAAVVGGAVVVTATGGPLSFTYTVSDGSGGTSTATATLLTVASTSGADSILGVATADMLHGQAGGDTLDGGAGADTLIGGLGDDVFLTDGLDQIVEAANGGFDEVRSALSHTLAQNVEALRLTGAAAVTGVGNGGANQLTGNGAANSLQGLGGADTLDGGGGADTLTGGTGDDVYIVDAATTVQEAAGEGAADEVRTALAAYTLAANVERLTGTSAAGQALTGNGLANSIAGGVGADTLAGGEGPDTLAGGLGDDIYLVEAGDVVSEAAGQGVDEVRTALASYTLTADVEHLTGQSGSGQALTGNGLGNAVRGGSGADTLSGGTGDDTVTGGAGNDSLSGGSGTDTVSYAGAAAVTVSLASTTAQATGGAGLDTLAGFENLIGSNGGDMLTGDERANGLYGWLGNDTLLGGAGADTLDGGEGVDTASWAGALVRVVADLSTGLANSPGGEVDQLILIERLVGSAFNDVLKGDGGANSLAGGDGADTLEGGLGNDSLDGGAGVDTVTYAGSAVGVVVNVTGNNQNTQGAGVDNLAGVENLVGSDFADTLRGDGGANSLVGGAGSDTLAGGLGDDTLAGGTGADTASYFGLAGGVVVDLGAAAPQATGAAGADTLLGIENVTGGNGGDVLSGDDGVNDLRGQGGEDRLVGRGGRDLLGGGDGADTIVGGLGKDRLTGGTGADTFVFETLADSGAAKAARDVIRDFSGTDGDRIDLSGLDAVSGGADDAFRLVAAFSGAAGELVVVQSRRATLIQGDVDGDGRADFSISLDGAHTLTADHFLL
jgi:VCBS repeat-containing protein